MQGKIASKAQMVLKQVDFEIVLHFFSVYDSIWAESSTPVVQVAAAGRVAWRIGHFWDGMDHLWPKLTSIG